MRVALVLSVFAGLLLAGRANAGPSLNVGSTPPPVHVAKWLKGQPLVSFEKGKIYVVEFWATWCGPCRQSIPHLTELAHKYRGKVSFTGISVMEEGKPSDYIPQVAGFVKEQGAGMDYTVGVDGAQGFMNARWKNAAGEDGIPTAFVIGREGKIAWIGHPMAMDDALAQIVAGKFNAQAFAAQRKKEQAGGRPGSGGAGDPLAKAQALLEKGRTKDALAELDRVLVAHPELVKPTALSRYSLLLKTNEKNAYAFARKLAGGALKDEPGVLDGIAWNIVRDGADVKTPDYDTAIILASRAVQATRAEEPGFLDTLSYAYYRKGNIDKAIECAETALRNVDKTSQPDRMRKLITQRLDTYRLKKKNR